MLGRKKNIGIPRKISDDSIRISKSDNKVKLFAKFNHKWYSTDLKDAFDITNQNDASVDSILTYTSTNKGKVIPRITANMAGEIGLWDSTKSSSVKLKEDSGKLSVDGDIDLASGSAFKINGVAIEGTAVTVTGKDYITLSGQQLTMGSIDLADDVTGLLPKAGVNTSSTWAVNDIPTITASKISDVETNADVTDATNVTAAGALMDSECTSLADVKALNQSVISGAVPTFTATNFTDATNKRFMTNAQETKLDSVASNADVTGSNTCDTPHIATNLSQSTGGSTLGINSSTGSNVTIAEATGSIAGLMTTAHHDKLDTIEDNAKDDQTKADIEGLGIQTVGAVTSGSWTATDVAVLHGGTGASTGGAALLNLGASTVGRNIFALTNPGAVSFLRMNILNTVTARSPAQFKADLDLEIDTDLQAWDAQLDSLSALTAAEVGYLDGPVAGQVIASKAVVVDANSRIDKLYIDGPAGFVQKAETWDSAGDQSLVDIDFNLTNKVYLTPDTASETIALGRLIFPAAISGNFVLIFKQIDDSGTGDSAVTSWAAYDGSTGSAATLWWNNAGVKPTLTAAAGLVDILSFYWDAEANFAYGSYVQGFQA